MGSGMSIDFPPTFHCVLISTFPISFQWLSRWCFSRKRINTPDKFTASSARLLGNSLIWPSGRVRHLSRNSELLELNEVSLGTLMVFRNKARLNQWWNCNELGLGVRMGCFEEALDSNILLPARPHARHEYNLQDCLLWRERSYKSRVHFLVSYGFQLFYQTFL